ncbi:MAG: hypothetical protein FWD66_02250 [Paludibacter sp.]|nr:hypothetical protein [Paludibacter sp.]
MERASGYTLERTKKGKPTFVRIDLRKNAFLIPILENNGFEIGEPIKWTDKMLKSFEQAENGEWEVGDINNFWGNEGDREKNG